MFFGGSWVAWGAGRVPVGVSPAESEFNTVEKTGGAKTHTLTVAEMPLHNHGGKLLAGGGELGLGGGSAYHARVLPSGTGWTGPGNAWGEPNIAAQGDGQAHNNLQPYITCYMWKRTA